MPDVEECINVPIKIPILALFIYIFWGNEMFEKNKACLKISKTT